MMYVERRLVAQRLIDKQVTGNAGYPLLSPDNMADFHGVVVHDIGQGICRIAGRSQAAAYVRPALFASRQGVPMRNSNNRHRPVLPGVRQPACINQGAATDSKVRNLLPYPAPRPSPDPATLHLDR